MVKNLSLAILLASTPVFFSACKNGTEAAAPVASVDAQHLKDVEAQVVDLRAENKRLHDENESLKANMAKMENDNERSRRQASRDVRPNETEHKNVPDMPRAKDAIRANATGGGSFQ